MTRRPPPRAGTTGRPVGSRFHWPAAFDRVLTDVEDDPRFARVGQVYATVGDQLVCDLHRRGPQAPDLFSVTKTVVGLLTGIALERGLLTSLELTLAEALPFPVPAHAANQRLHHLLTMTRGAAVDGRWELDQVALLRQGWGPTLAAAPQRREPGAAFAYDNGGVHLLACALQAAVGDLVSFAESRLFGPLGIDGWSWARDPAGVPVGTAHLAMAASALARVGRLIVSDGFGPDGRRLVSSRWIGRMCTSTTSGGPPEDRPYGHLLWIEDPSTFFGAGWAGNLLLVRPREGLVVVTTGDPAFDYGPPARDEMPADWRPPLELLRRHVLD